VLKHSNAEVLNALENLPEGIDAIYDEAMERIETQQKGNKELAERILSWITYAYQPLSVKKLRVALSVLPFMTKLDTQDLIYKQKLTSVCAGLVVIDREHQVVRLVRKYLMR
jgi:hypothetical protein